MGQLQHDAKPKGLLDFPILPSSAAVHSSSGMATPPLHTLASVPFRWEEEPGKPHPCTDIIPLPEPTYRCLDLPPGKMTKLPSPTTVLHSSLRIFKEGSFDSSSSGGGGSPGSALDLLLGKKKNKGFVGRGSFGFSRSVCERCRRVVKMEKKTTRNGRSIISTTHLWVSLRESLKQAMAWRNGRKSRK